MGNNGVGKSTLLKAICGLIQIKSGAINLNKQSIGYLPESYLGPQFLTCHKFMVYAGKLFGLSRKTLIKKIDTLFNLLNLNDYSNTKIMHLSKGTAQRLYIAQAMINDPNLLILDEPFSGLDNPSIVQLSSFIKNIAQEGKSIIVSTHISDKNNFDRFIRLRLNTLPLRRGM